MTSLITISLLRDYVAQVLETDSSAGTVAWRNIAQNFSSGRGNQGLSLWDSYNGITEWINHQLGCAEAPRLESAWFGSGANLRDKAHLEALALL